MTNKDKKNVIMRLITLIIILSFIATSTLMLLLAYIPLDLNVPSVSIDDSVIKRTFVIFYELLGYVAFLIPIIMYSYAFLLLGHLRKIKHKNLISSIRKKKTRLRSNFPVGVLLLIVSLPPLFDLHFDPNIWNLPFYGGGILGSLIADSLIGILSEFLDSIYAYYLLTYILMFIVFIGIRVLYPFSYIEIADTVGATVFDFIKNTVANFAANRNHTRIMRTRFDETDSGVNDDFISRDNLKKKKKTDSRFRQFFSFFQDSKPDNESSRDNTFFDDQIIIDNENHKSIKSKDDRIYDKKQVYDQAKSSDKPIVNKENTFHNINKASIDRTSSNKTIDETYVEKDKTTVRKNIKQVSEKEDKNLSENTKSDTEINSVSDKTQDKNVDEKKEENSAFDIDYIDETQSNDNVRKGNGADDATKPVFDLDDLQTIEDITVISNVELKSAFDLAKKIEERVTSNDFNSRIYTDSESDYINPSKENYIVADKLYKNPPYQDVSYDDSLNNELNQNGRNRSHHTDTTYDRIKSLEISQSKILEQLGQIKNSDSYNDVNNKLDSNIEPENTYDSIEKSKAIKENSFIQISSADNKDIKIPHDDNSSNAASQDGSYKENITNLINAWDSMGGDLPESIKNINIHKADKEELEHQISDTQVSNEQIFENQEDNNLDYLENSEKQKNNLEEEQHHSDEEKNAVYQYQNYGYKLPPYEILNPPSEEDDTSINEQEAIIKSKELEKVLSEFGVEASVQDVIIGPVVTMFSIMLAPGTKASKLQGLEQDLARSLSIMSVRVVPILPGQPYIGIEIPNINRKKILLSEVISSEDYNDNKSRLSLVLGKDINDNPIIGDLTKMPHLLVAGTTGSGKSVGINAMIMGLLYRYDPDYLRLLLIDPKMLELNLYDSSPHLLSPVIADMKNALKALQWCSTEMDRRYQIMARVGVRNIQGFNARRLQAQKKTNDDRSNIIIEDENGKEVFLSDMPYMPYIVIVIDEFADMIMTLGKKGEEVVVKIAQKARASGIHLIIATQRPSVDVITGLIKANIPSRIAYMVSSKIDSRTIIDQNGAEQLLGQGDMLYLAIGSMLPERVHGAFVDEYEIQKAVEFWNKQNPSNYDDVLMRYLSGSTSEVLNISDKEKDPIYNELYEMIISDQKVPSISMVQRKFQIGFNRAARLLEDLELNKVVSPVDNRGKRTLL